MIGEPIPTKDKASVVSGKKTLTISDFSSTTYKANVIFTSAEKNAWFASKKATFVLVYSGTTTYYKKGSLSGPIITFQDMLTSQNEAMAFKAPVANEKVAEFAIQNEPSGNNFFMTAFITLTAAGYTDLSAINFDIYYLFE